MTLGASLETWEGRAVEAWRQSWGLPGLRILRSTASTNDDVRALAADGAPAGTLVLTEHQTAGRGRQGRTWHDAPGSSLLFSVLLRPAASNDPAPGTAPLRIGLAVARALHESSGIDARIKWPNDIVCGDRKVAGILCEATSDRHAVSLVAGIGINVRRNADAPPEIRASASSLEAESDTAIDRAAVMTSVVEALRPLLVHPLAPLSSDELADYRRLDALFGREVSVIGDARHDTGNACGIAPDGALLLDTRTGRARITSATVRLQPGPHEPPARLHP